MTKNLLLAIALVLSFNTVTSKKAEAGLIVAGMVTIASDNINENIGGILGLSGMVIAATSSIFFITKQIPLSTFRPIYYIGLDANGTLPQERLVDDFSKRYSFIDNQEVIKSLVSKIKNKYEVNRDPGNEYTNVSLSSQEVDEQFSGIDLTQDELKLIKSDLI